jgi:hypothetical protein
MQWLLLIIYFDGNFPNAKLHPYDDYKNVHFKYILWDFEYLTTLVVIGTDSTGCWLKLISHYNDNFITCYKQINGL